MARWSWYGFLSSSSGGSHANTQYAFPSKHLKSSFLTSKRRISQDHLLTAAVPPISITNRSQRHKRLLTPPCLHMQHSGVYLHALASSAALAHIPMGVLCQAVPLQITQTPVPGWFLQDSTRCKREVHQALVDDDLTQWIVALALGACTPCIHLLRNFMLHSHARKCKRYVLLPRPTANTL